MSKKSRKRPTASEELFDSDLQPPDPATSLTPVPNFPCSECLPGCEAETYIRKVQKLLRTNWNSSQYADVVSARRLIATMLRSYVRSQDSPRWQADGFLTRLKADGKTLPRVLAAIFDYATNLEYCSTRFNRVNNSNWIYCNAAKHGEGGTGAGTEARVFYSFLKQCPFCCLEVGRGARIADAQHKPPSRHIGDITGFLMSTLLQVVLQSNTPPLTLGLIASQQHDVDAVAFNSELAILIEVKASPLVTFPLACDLASAMLRETEQDKNADNAAVEYERHTLINGFPYSTFPLYLFIPHRNLRIELGHPTADNFPYVSATDYVADVDGFLNYLSAWAELYEAYAVPKTRREGRVARVAFLTNGWGDDVDSNKTKPGLGRTDDLKKGTYQMLKYGAYYKDLCARRVIHSALVANLDPVNLWAQYLERLLDVRWTKERYAELKEGVFHVPRERFYHLFEAIIAFNNPVVNEPVLKEAFNFERTDAALKNGSLNAALLDAWVA